MAFRKKAPLIADYNADILVIQESESSERLDTELLRIYPNMIWFGDNKHKGLLVAAKKDYRIQQNPSHSNEFRYIVPIQVNGTRNFNLVAVWAQNDSKMPKARYIGQVWLALNRYQDIIERNTVIIGDFNSNKIWDNSYPRVATHSDVVEFLARKNIQSVYHSIFQEKHGEESKKTFFLYRSVNRGFHIDYCFASNDLAPKNFVIPSSEDWLSSSDHVPIIIDF